MFPNLKVHFVTPTGTSPRLRFAADEESGIVETRVVPCNVPLPSADMFDVVKMAKAGITLKEVNTKVLSDSDSLDSFIEKSIKSNSKKSSDVAADDDSVQPSNNKDN